MIVNDTYWQTIGRGFESRHLHKFFYILPKYGGDWLLTMVDSDRKRRLAYANDNFALAA